MDLLLLRTLDIVDLESQWNMDKKENIKTAETGERKSRIDWSKWDAILFVVLAPFIFLAVVVMLIPTGGLSYLSGFYNFPFDFIFVGLVVVNHIGKVMEAILFPFVVAGCLFIIIRSIRAFITWKRYTRRKRIIGTAQIGIQILLITLYFYVFFLSNYIDLFINPLRAALETE